MCYLFACLAIFSFFLLLWGIFLLGVGFLLLLLGFSVSDRTIAINNALILLAP